MRIAWLGPVPHEGYGVPQVAFLLLRELAAHGHDITVFSDVGAGSPPRPLLDLPNLRFVVRRNPARFVPGLPSRGFLGFGLATLGRGATQYRLARDVIRRNKRTPFDLVYQFSQPELLGLGRHSAKLPPIVLHPQVHAAGELRSLRRERGQLGSSRARLVSFAMEWVLGLRAKRQAQDFRRAAMVVTPSATFADHLHRDCDVPHSRLAVVPNPVDTARFSVAVPSQDPERRLLFIARMAVRKGVELAVDLSYRLKAEDRAHLLVVGGGGGWSDYTPLLAELNPLTASHQRDVSGADLPSLFQNADVVLQLSHYEPFGLSVAEALSSGCLVVASDAVGATERVVTECCWRFPAGDAAALLDQVRAALARCREPARRSLAREEAVRLFAPDVVARRLARELEMVVSRKAPDPGG